MMRKPTATVALALSGALAYSIVSAAPVLAAPPDVPIVDVNVVNDANTPVLVTGTADVNVMNLPGVISFHASGFDVVTVNPAPFLATLEVDLNFHFELPGSDRETSDRVPAGKMAVVEFLSCEITTLSGNITVQPLAELSASEGGSGRGSHYLPVVSTGLVSGGLFTVIAAYVSSEVRLHVPSSGFLDVETAVSDVAEMRCEASGYFLDEVE